MATTRVGLIAAPRGLWGAFRARTALKNDTHCTTLMPLYSRQPSAKSSPMRPYASADVAAEVAIEGRKVIAEDFAFQSIPEIWESVSSRYGDEVAVYDPHRKPPYSRTYRELRAEMEAFAYGLQSLGLIPAQTVALFAEASPRWIVADQAIMMNAANNAVRGASAPLAELQRIVLHSDSMGLVVQDESTLQTLLQHELSPPTGHKNGLRQQQEQFSHVLQSKIEFAVVLWGDLSGTDVSDVSFPVYTYEQLLSLGTEAMRIGAQSLPQVKKEDVATIVYTSGTSGLPKGVALSHGNLLYQISCFKEKLPLYPAEQILSLLPPWHIYERATAYHVFQSGCRVVYTGVVTLKNDLSRYPTAVFFTVPLVLDTLYKRVCHAPQ